MPLPAANGLIELNPFGTYGGRAWNNRGAALDNLRRHDEAIESYDEAILIDPFDIHAWNNKGVALSALGRHEEALRCFYKAIEIQPMYPLHGRIKLSVFRHWAAMWGLERHLKELKN